MGRLHEREGSLTNLGAFAVFGYAGILGYLTRGSEKHIIGQLCVYIGDVLLVGSLNLPRPGPSDGREINRHGIRRANGIDRRRGWQPGSARIRPYRFSGDHLVVQGSRQRRQDACRRNPVPATPRRYYALRSAVVRY